MQLIVAYWSGLGAVKRALLIHMESTVSCFAEATYVNGRYRTRTCDLTDVIKDL
jgi:hypothetical protein